MRLYLTLFILLSIGTPAWAKAKASGASRSGASALPSDCIQTALTGRYEGECWNDHESDACVGMRLALHNSQKKDRCYARAGEGCLVHGHLQNTQAQWVAVAAGYLGEFAQCVRKQYGSDDSSGFQEALADPRFRDRLIGLEDGGGAFGLKEGDLLERTLKGETFAEVLASSPAWQRIDARERDRMLLAAENPTTPETTAVIPPPRLAFSGVKPFATENIPNREPSSLAAPPVAPAVSAPINTPAPNGAGKYYVRKIKHNPYSLGLDLSLFDRVSTAYQKRSPELRGIDDYVRSLPKKELKDVRDLLSGNRGVEI